MSPSNELTREELLELAELEAYGVLDEYELARFNRGFANAATAVQEEIRNLQASIVADPTLMASDEPDVELKHSVLAAVAHAIEEENERLSPIATIGGGSRHASSAATSVVAMAGPIYMWRAATFALAAGLIVCIFFLARSFESNQALIEAREREVIVTALSQHGGSDLRDMLIRQHQGRSIVKVATGSTGLAAADLAGVCLVDDNRGTATLLVFGLPGDRLETMHIQVRGEDGQVTRLESDIKQEPGTTIGVAHLGKILPSMIALLQTGTIEVLDGAGNVLMRSA